MALTRKQERRTQLIVETLDDAFAPLMTADPAAFRAKYRKMARDPHAFFRGTACLFDADVTAMDDPFVDDRASRIWIHGDLHVENFGTYLSSEGVLVFDVNDFDEAYLGHFSWDLMRFAASLALTCWQKALPEEDVRRLVARFATPTTTPTSRSTSTPRPVPSWRRCRTPARSGEPRRSTR
jgi:uncharacterized protein (DUF2252 family)